VKQPSTTFALVFAWRRFLFAMVAALMSGGILLATGSDKP